LVAGVFPDEKGRQADGRTEENLASFTFGCRTVGDMAVGKFPLGNVFKS
jgi:hypothetical protein